MGSEEKRVVELESLDMYSGIKLRSSSSRSRCIRNGSEKSERGRIRKVKAYYVGNVSRVNYQFELGDLVWGKITSYPWWPGRIYEEALASPEVLSAKKKGCVLVFLYGDYTYAWIDPKALVPFEAYYLAKRRQKLDALFQKGVEEAVMEVRRRSLLGLICCCPGSSKFRLISSRGEEEQWFEVGFCGFVDSGIYSSGQISKARDDFRPGEILGFLKDMASSPRNFCEQNVGWISITTRLLFYGWTRIQNFDEASYMDTLQERSCEHVRGSPDEKDELALLLSPKAPHESRSTLEKKGVGLQNSNIRANEGPICPKLTSPRTFLDHRVCGASETERKKRLFGLLARCDEVLEMIKKVRS